MAVSSGIMSLSRTVEDLELWALALGIAEEGLFSEGNGTVSMATLGRNFLGVLALGAIGGIYQR